MQDIPGALLQAASGGHPGAATSIRSHDYYGDARTHMPPEGGGVPDSKPAAACGTRASRMHGTRNVQLAGSPAVASRPEEAARCLEVTLQAPGRAFTIRICRIWRELSAHTAGPCQNATNASLMLGRCDLLAPCASLPPCRGTSRGRMRGIGATCTAPTTKACRPKRMISPEHCKIGAG
jgi:hypothetical protein